MKTQGYGRFVMIASSAGLFGQPHAAHYGAAKAGIFGLTNVIAVEGAAHGILANAVLPFGQSRMVWETRGERQPDADDESFIGAIRPELVVPIVTFLAEPRVHVQPPQLLGRRRALRPRVRRFGTGLAGAERLAADGGRHSGAPRRGVGDRSRSPCRCRSSTRSSRSARASASRCSASTSRRRSRQPADDAVVVQPFDLVAVVPDLGEDRARVLAQLAERGCATRRVRQREHRCVPPVGPDARVLHRGHHLDGARLRVAVQEREVRHVVGHDAAHAGRNAASQSGAVRVANTAASSSSSSTRCSARAVTVR